MPTSKLQFYFLNSDFGENRTGIENASLLRARIFKKHFGTTPVFLTTTWNPRLNIQRRKLVDNGLLGEDGIIMNLYEYFQETITIEQEKYADNWATNNRWTYKQVENTRDHKISDDQGRLVMYRKCNDDGLLLYNNICVNGKIVRRDAYDSNGYLNKVQFLDPDKNGRVCTESYYRTDGTICMYKFYRLVGDKNEMSGIQMVNKSGQLTAIFESEAELIASWINQIIKPGTFSFLIIDRERTYYDALKEIRNPYLFRVSVLHSSHLRSAKDPMTDNINSNYTGLFEDLSKADAIVTLTNRQREHIEKRFGQRDNLFVIPHSTEKEYERITFEKRTPRKAIYLARYSEEKQHSSLVRVFGRVVEKYPDARLEFYGFGSKKEELLKQIQELHLENNIFVNDFVHDPGEIYDTASLALLSSRVEGFSLFLLEAIAHGCPAISYDIDYGPKDMIDSGMNGYLVEYDNEEAMAERIIEVFGNMEKLKAMSEASYKKAEAFHPNVVAEKWASLVDKVLSRKLTKS